ncbi:MAG: VWA domain-containing protein [Phycisphaerae bacterium]|nr:VWA domain-containing protein [Phycisphaerae bacterium]
MKTIHIRTVCLLLLAGSLVTTTGAQSGHMIVQPAPRVQMAILLDTSGSMSGLIDQARTEVWAIVNQFITATRDGKAPDLQVALYEYGKSALPAEKGYIRQIVPFTHDLDKISEELFALKTNGGEEYCGWVIKDAVEGLAWSGVPNDLKVIFIAGNEPFSQGPVKYQDACKSAIAKGIVVNTIHCGPENAGVDGKWKDGALLADGQFLSIDHNRAVVHIAAPQDKELAELGAKLNTTYLAYGRLGRDSAARQSAQDMNAAASSSTVATQRVAAKASFNYRNSAWDLVDALKYENADLSKLKAEDLPEEMRKMTAEEQKAYVEAKAKERAQIQQQIQQLNDARTKYVAEQMKKQAGGAETLGSAIIEAVRKQAEAKQFKFEHSSSSKVD